MGSDCCYKCSEQIVFVASSAEEETTVKDASLYVKTSRGARTVNTQCAELSTKMSIICLTIGYKPHRHTHFTVIDRTPGIDTQPQGGLDSKCARPCLVVDLLYIGYSCMYSVAVYLCCEVAVCFMDLIHPDQGYW